MLETSANWNIIDTHYAQMNYPAKGSKMPKATAKSWRRRVEECDDE